MSNKNRKTIDSAAKVENQEKTVVSRMPKTIDATASSLLMHIFAWKKILGKVAD